METTSPAARDLLLGNLAALRERLAEHEIRMERFDVKLAARSLGWNGGRTSQQSPAWRTHDSSALRPQRDRQPIEAIVASAASTASAADRLDVVV